MKKLFIFSLFICLFTLTAKAQEVHYLTAQEFKDLIFDYTSDSPEWKYKGKKPCVIDFYTTWCGPCKRLAPIMEELAKEYGKNVIFYKVDTEKERELAVWLQISSIPQVLFVPTSGKPSIAGGLRPKEFYVEAIDKFLLKK